MQASRRVVKLLPFAISLALPLLANAQEFIKDNGVIKAKLNGKYNGISYPIITDLWVANSLLVPHDNAGADMQFTVRSASGDAYNPTLAGDCNQNASILTGYISDWNAAYLNLPKSNGILLGVTPLNYNEPPSGCVHTKEVTPYEMNFGVSLGDGVSFPKQAMILDMAVRRSSAVSQVIKKRLSEMPVAFGFAEKMRYAYYSRDGYSFTPVYFNNDPSRADIMAWPTSPTVNIETAPNSTQTTQSGNWLPPAKVIMTCDIPYINVTTENTGTCMAFYADRLTAIAVSHRASDNNLTLMGMLGDVSINADIADQNWHTLRRLVAVGNPNTVRAVITQTRSKVDNLSSW